MITSDLLAASLGTMMGSPHVLIAGLWVARISPKRPRFWLELIAAIIVCTALQFSFDQGMNDIPSSHGLGGWFVLVTFATIYATIIFLAVRKLRKMLKRDQNAA